MQIIRLLVMVVCIAGTGLVLAESYPTKPIRLINPYAAGVHGELLAREVGLPLGTILGQPVIIESRPGGGATLGADAVSKSAPDGYTLLIGGAPSLVISPAMQAKPAYDGLADFTPICMFVTVPNVLVLLALLLVHPVDGSRTPTGPPCNQPATSWRRISRPQPTHVISNGAGGPNTGNTT
ncbi:MAG: Bug family tripartite tricarboxylate transporter substrate binding protein [Burkholderiales bacterium]